MTHPVSSTEVYCFSKVIALVETTVVGSREGNDKLSSTLVGSDNLQKHTGGSNENRAVQGRHTYMLQTYRLLTGTP